MQLFNLILLLSFFIFPALLSGQGSGCSGNLGNNIFTDGDFGTGITNILQTDPGIAPGYTYTTAVPPEDGYYVITKNTAAWPFIHPTWLRISDNSADPDGYMMVVNADFTPGLFYSELVEGLCESTAYEFSADVINFIQTGVSGHIKPDVSFLIDGIVFFTTGQIPQDERWHSYGFSFDTEPGQTSVLLSLRNNAPGGVGNDLALDNISFRPCGPEAQILPLAIENICEDGDPVELIATVVGNQYDTPAFQWQRSFDEGQSWENIPGAVSETYTHTELSAGFYYYRYLLANALTNLQNTKCRVNSNIKIVHVVPKFYEITDTICDGLTYLNVDGNYSESGIYIDSLFTLIGCDSIVTLNLTVVPDPEMDVNAVVVDLNCQDVDDGAIELLSITNASPPLDIRLLSLPEFQPVNFENLPAGDFLLTISDRHGCTFEERYTIVSPPPFLIDIGPDRTILLGDAVAIRPNANMPVQSISWSSVEQIDCPAGCLSAEWFPGISQSISVEAISEKGCVATDQMLVSVLKDRRIFIPNAFSPNNDGFNDHFTVFGQSPNIQYIKVLQVFNRWGALIFENYNFQPNDLASGWDGKYKEKQLDEGLYVYRAEVLFLDGVVEQFAGGISLLK